MVKSVRLACLMCAASVYPEPGSNSQFNFYNILRISAIFFVFIFEFFDSFKLLFISF